MVEALSTPLLRITDGTRTVSLLNRNGLMIQDWRPAAMHRIAAGAGDPQQAQQAAEEVTEAMTIELYGATEVEVAAQLDLLLELLEKARNYWGETWQTEPVWIESKTKYEENPKYAVIRDYRLPDIKSYFGPSFSASRGHSTDFDLVIVHRPWLSHPPGEATALEISGELSSAGTLDSDPPLIGPDDCITNDDGTFDAAETMSFMGDAGTPWGAGIRFRDVQLATGLTIDSAYVRFEAAENQSGTTVRIRIKGEKGTDPADFSAETRAGYFARTRTTNYEDWSPGAWTAGNSYDTPDLAAVIQEIINDPAWDYEDDLVLFFDDNGSDPDAIRYGEAVGGGGASPALVVTYSIESDIAASADDAYIDDSSIYTASHTLWMADAGGDAYYFGLRFLGLTIPQGVSIDSAFVRLYVDEVTTIACYVEIFGQDATSPGDFSGDSRADFLARSRTTNSQTWTVPAFGGYGDPHDTPDIAAIIEEIITRGDWTSGSGLVIFFEPDGLSSDIRGARAIDAPESEVSELHVTVLISATPSAQADDCIVDNTSLTYTETESAMGATASTWHTGIRFRNIPLGASATILAANVTFEAAETDVGTDCNVRIYGELNRTPASFLGGSYASFFARPRTVAYEDWTVPAWTAGNSYNSTDIAAILQEIINHADWSTGNDLVLFFQDNGSDSEAHRRAYAYGGGGTLPVLSIFALDPASPVNTRGRSATTADEVYVVNKDNTAQITHIFHYDDSAAAWSANLVGSGTPYELLPSPVETDDIVYFGISVADDPFPGPFNNLVFDLSAVLTHGASSDLDWEYWDAVAGAWQALTVSDETSDPPADNEPFSASGVCSVHWEQPEFWVPTNVNGETCWWVRCYVTDATDLSGVPEQDNRDVYTICWSDVNIDEDQVEGQLDLRLKADLVPQSCYDRTADAVQGHANYCMMGVRTLARGEQFRAFVPLAESFFQTTAAVIGDVSTSQISEYSAPVGYCMNTAGVGSSGWHRVLTATFPAGQIAAAYTGLFRIFLRYYRATDTVTDAKIKLAVTGGEIAGTKLESEEIALVENVNWAVADFGLFALPPAFIRPPVGQQWPVTLTLYYYSGNGDASEDIDWYDFVLIPTDEWAGEFYEDLGAIEENFDGYPITVNETFSVDPLSDPKNGVTAYVSGGISGPWSVDTDEDPRLRVDVDQQIFFFWQTCRQTDDFKGVRVSYPWIAARVQVSSARRYVFMRGDK